MGNNNLKKKSVQRNGNEQVECPRDVFVGQDQCVRRVGRQTSAST